MLCIGCETGNLVPSKESKMKEIRFKLSDEDYEIVKKIDFSEIKDEVILDDKTKEFRTTSDLADVIFEEYINAHAFDGSAEYNVTPFGRKLYEIYDLIFFSEEI